MECRSKSEPLHVKRLMGTKIKHTMSCDSALVDSPVSLCVCVCAFSWSFACRACLCLQVCDGECFSIGVNFSSPAMDR